MIIGFLQYIFLPGSRIKYLQKFHAFWYKIFDVFMSRTNGDIP